MSTPSPRTLLGPLTDVWTQPPVCSYAMARCATCTTVWYAQTCNQASEAHDWTGCWPPRASSVTADPGVMMGWGFYSPGLSCPVGYTTVAKATAGGSSGWGIEYSMEDGETAMACCPTGYGITSVVASNTYAQTCITTATATSLLTVQCENGSFTDFSVINLPSAAPSYIIYAPLIQLNYQLSDLPNSPTTTSTTPPQSSSSASPLPTSSSTPSSTSSPSASSSSSILSTASSSSSSGPSSSSTSLSSSSVGAGAGQAGSGGSSSNSSGGLSSGAKAGIGVGVALGALILFLVAFLLYRARRRRAQEPPQVLEKRDPKKLPFPPQHELGGNEVRELEAANEPQELATSPQHRGTTPPAQSIFQTSDGFPYLGGPPVFELEGDSAPSTPVRGDHTAVSAASTPVRRDHGEVVSPTTPVRRSQDI